MGKEGKFEIIKSYKKFSFIFWLFLNIRRGRFRDGWWHTYILILGLCFLFVMQTFTFRFLLNAPSELKRTPETTLLGNLGNIECPFVLVFIAGFAKICYVIECFINSGKVPSRFHFPFWIIYWGHVLVKFLPVGTNQAAQRGKEMFVVLKLCKAQEKAKIRPSNKNASR